MKYTTYFAETPAQLDEVFRFRYEVFTLEQHKCVATADHERRKLSDALDMQAVHLCVASKDGLVGALRQLRGAHKATDAIKRNVGLQAFASFPSEQIAITGRLFIRPEHRGSTALHQLLHFTYTSGREAGIVFDLIYCNPHLVRLYEHLGYRRYRPYFEDPDVGFNIPLALVADDVAYLQRIRSPFVPLAGQYGSDPKHAAWFSETFRDFAEVISPMALGMEEFTAILSRKIHEVQIPLFVGLTEEQLDAVLKMATHLRVKAGTNVVRQGNLGQELFVILDGVAEVSRTRQDGSLQRLGTLGRGDMFGEASVLTSQPRSATVFAATALEVVFFDQVTLNKLVKARPDIASPLLLNLSKALAERIVLRELEQDAAVAAGVASAAPAAFVNG